jgi:hypothetical protein
MERFFQLMERDPNVAIYLINHIVSLSRTMVIDPTQPLELPFWLAALPAPEAERPKLFVIGAEHSRARALWQAQIEGRWTGDEQTRRYTGYVAGERCLEVALDRRRDALEFTFL